MNEQEVKDYIIRYNNIYSQEQIISQLRGNGIEEDKIRAIYSQVKYGSNSNLENKFPQNIALFIILSLGLILLAFNNSDSIISVYNENFGTPKSVELGSPLRVILEETQINTDESNIKIYFTYVGTRLVDISSEGKINRDDGSICPGVYVVNLDVNNQKENKTSFLNGQKGFIEFSCDSIQKNDIFQGKIEIPVLNTRGLNLISRGEIKYKIE